MKIEISDEWVKRVSEASPLDDIDLPPVGLPRTGERSRFYDLLTETGRKFSGAWVRACEALIASQLGERTIEDFALTHTLVETEPVGGGRIAWLVPSGEAHWPPRWPRVEMRPGDGFSWSVGIVDRDPSTPGSPDGGKAE